MGSSLTHKTQCYQLTFDLYMTLLNLIPLTITIYIEYSIARIIMGVCMGGCSKVVKGDKELVAA